MPRRCKETTKVDQLLDELLGYPSLEYRHFGNLCHHFSIDRLLEYRIEFSRVTVKA